MTASSSWRRLAARLGVEHPLIQAPMAGGYSTPELVAAVSNAGGLGSVAAGYLSPDDIVKQAKAVRALTQRPYAINLFAPVAPPPAADPTAMLAILERHHQALGLPAPQPPRNPMPDFAEQVEAVLASAPAVFSFTFGIPPASVLESFRSRGILLAGTATTVTEALQLEAAGVDVIVTQGAEAGGHRGTFAAPFEGALVGTMALVPQVVDAVKLPVVASGGIMDGRGIAAARMLGASGVQLGTAFMTCREAGTSEAHKALIRAAPTEATRITRAFSGRPARGLANAFSTELEGSDAVLPFPLQHAATTPLRKEATRRGDPRFIALWAGQGAALAREGSAADLFRSLIEASESLLGSAAR